MFASAIEVPGRGLEPLRISPPDPKSGASANFATLAFQLIEQECAQFTPARDSRNRRVPGLYIRNGRYYCQSGKAPLGDLRGGSGVYALNTFSFAAVKPGLQTFPISMK